MTDDLEQMSNAPPSDLDSMVGRTSWDAVSPAAPSKNVFDQAREQYPILDKHGVVGVINPKEGSNMLEFWPPGEPGSDDAKRPAQVPIDKPGVEVYSGKTTPLDILGDVTSHHLVKSDPVIKQQYEDFQSSINPQQQQILQSQYEYAKKNDGESRPYDQWLEASGMPAYFRGYAFKQWPEEFNQRAYTPAQRQGFDKMMNYLSGAQ